MHFFATRYTFLLTSDKTKDNCPNIFLILHKNGLLNIKSSDLNQFNEHPALQLLRRYTKEMPMLLLENTII